MVFRFGVRCASIEVRERAELIVRQPHIVVGGLRFYRAILLYKKYLFLFSSATLRTRWTELNQNRPHGRKWVQFENACPKSGYPLLLIIGGPKTTFFRRLRNLTASLMINNSERYTIYIIGQVRCKLQGVSYIVSKRHELWSTNG